MDDMDITARLEDTVENHPIIEMVLGVELGAADVSVSCLTTFAFMQGEGLGRVRLGLTCACALDFLAGCVNGPA